MFFRNLQLYRLPANWDMTAERLAEQLGRLMFRPCGSQDLATQGWISPVQDQLVFSVDGQWMISLCVETRILPASVINQETEERAKKFETQQGFKPGRKQTKEIKECVLIDLLPKAFTRRRKVYAWIDPKAGYLAVDSSSRSAAEPLIEALHKALDELPLKLINTERSPATAMTDWLAGGEAPDAFTIDQDGELRAVTDEASAVRYVHHSLEGHEIREHIASGKQVSKLALTFDDRLSFILTDKFEIKRLQPLDTLTESDSQDSLTREEQFQADFALMTGELRRLIPELIEILGGEVQTI